MNAAVFLPPSGIYIGDLGMKIEQIIRKITSSAIAYKESILNQNLLFIFGNTNCPDYFEAVFYDANFRHLTGVSIRDNKFSNSQFFERCTRGALNPSDIVIPNDGTVELKLTVLPHIIQIEKTAKMIGDYNNSKALLYTEKLAGGVFGCIGFNEDGKSKYFVPNTVLREDIRDVTLKPQSRVLAVYKKPIGEKRYSTLCSAAKNIDLDAVIQKIPAQLLAST